MKRKALASTLAALWLAAVGTATAQSTGITYQGRLADGGIPANGTYDLRFILYTSDVGGSQAGSLVFKNDVPVGAGLFTVDLDFGANVFTGDPRWMEIAVRPGTSTGLYTPLNPRQAVTPTPYALFSSTAGSVASGAVGSAQLAAGAVGNTNLQNLTITASKVASGQVVKSLNGLRDDVILAAGPNIGLATNGNTLLISGSGSAAGAWNLNGNSGTAISNFLGTTDNLPLEIRVNGQRAFRLEPNYNGAPNVVAGAPVNTVDAGIVGATIGGGGAVTYIDSVYSNRVSGDFGTVSGGAANVSSRGYATVAGGILNTSSNAGATVSGGARNLSSGWYSTVGGGEFNASTTNDSVVGGGFENTSSGFRATVGGGHYNVSSSHSATVGGGQGNTSGGFAATIGGGAGNRSGSTNSDWATVGGGGANTAIGMSATVSGGIQNTSSGNSSTVAGGQKNTSSGNCAAIGGGVFNTNSGSYGTIPGGFRNTVSGFYSLAAGRRANAAHNGSFVWGDGNDADVASTNANSVTFRASGGYRLLTGTGSAGAYLAPGSGSWTSMSDRDSKENFSSADAAGILAKVVTMPVSTWNYKSQPASVRHIGPTAQDFKASFGVGDSDTGITQVDADGVALAAIQGLAQIVKEKDKRIDDLEKRLAQLEALAGKLAEAQAAQGGNLIAH